MFGRRILLLIPHPDDEVVGCCAAIGQARAQGARVFGFYLTTGIPPRHALWWWQKRGYAGRIARRRREAEEAAEFLGIEAHQFQQVPCRTLKSFLGATRTSVEHAIRTLDIDILWAPAYEGGHQDHDTTSFLASTLKERLSVWEFAGYNYFAGKVASQRFFDSNRTEHTVKLSPKERERKRKALSIYRSERANLSYVDVVQEVFRPQASYDYAKPPHPGKLFYQRFQWVLYHPRVDFCRPREVCAAFNDFINLPQTAEDGLCHGTGNQRGADGEHEGQRDGL